MRFWIQTLLSVAILLLLFEGMVYAFRLLNLPRDGAVAGGTVLLALLATGGFVALRFTWRSSFWRSRSRSGSNNLPTRL